MSDEVLVGVPVEQARERLLNLVRLGGLQAVVTGAICAAEQPAGTTEVDASALTVETLSSYLQGEVTVVPLRWSTTSPSSRSFPAMDGNLELQRADPSTSRLGITGIYRAPPGQSLSDNEKDDARATIRRFLSCLSPALAIESV